MVLTWINKLTYLLLILHTAWLIYFSIELHLADDPHAAPHTDLHHSAIHNNVSLLDVSCFDVDGKDAQGLTALHYVAEHTRNDSHLETAKILLENKADVNAKSHYSGDTPLHLLLNNEHDNPKMLRLFLERGADFTMKNNNGEQPRNVSYVIGAIMRIMREETTDRERMFEKSEEKMEKVKSDLRRLEAKLDGRRSLHKLALFSGIALVLLQFY